MYLKMFVDGNDGAALHQSSSRTNNDLNERVDDLDYSHTFKTKQIDDGTALDPYNSKNSRVYQQSRESLFDRES